MRQTNQPAEHCASYYAATAIENTDYPVLQGAQTADICVVGAGFTGIATALTLAERGYSVIVVEANRIGWGASGRNGGQLICGISGESKLARQYGSGIVDLLWEMRWRGNDIVHDRVAKYDIPCDLKNGYIDVAIKSRHLHDLEEGFREYAAPQVSVRIPAHGPGRDSACYRYEGLHRWAHQYAQRSSASAQPVHRRGACGRWSSVCESSSSHRLRKSGTAKSPGSSRHPVM